MKDFFKFDDRRIVFKILLCLCCALLILTIMSLKEAIEVFVGLLISLIFFITITIFIFNEGIHFNYKKEKIVIVQGMMIKSINMNDVKYFNIEEVSKKRKKDLVNKFFDSYRQIGTPEYVYNNGKIFKIVFHMKKEDIVIDYYWLYKTTSIERINRQLEEFKKIKERFMKYKKY